ncbi:hypothetical protein PJP10_31695, partial [Mycobacterium kansasii]
LWAYTNSPRTNTGMSPFSLTYEHDAVVPLQIIMLSLRIAHQAKLIPPEFIEDMLVKFERLDET